MSDGTEAALGLLDLADERLNALDADTKDSIIDSASDLDFDGIVIAAPARVAAGEQDDLPVSVLTQRSGQRNWEVAPFLNSQLVAVDQVTGRGYVSHLYASPKRIDMRTVERSRAGDPPGEMDAGSRDTGLRVFGARGLLNLDWEDARLSLTVISHDWRSNTITTRIEGAPSEEAPAFDRDAALAVQKETSERGGAESGALDAPGVRLAVTPEKAGAIRLEVRARLPIGAALRDADAPGASDDAITGALPVFVVVTRLDDPTPSRASILLPLVGAPRGDDVEAVAIVDLRPRLDDALAPGDHLVWAFAGDQVGGPVPLRVD